MALRCRGHPRPSQSGHSCASPRPSLPRVVAARPSLPRVVTAQRHRVHPRPVQSGRPRPGWSRLFTAAATPAQPSPARLRIAAAVLAQGGHGSMLPRPPPLSPVRPSPPRVVAALRCRGHSHPAQSSYRSWPVPPSQAAAAQSHGRLP
jgi:hypothetical protein